MNCNTCTHYNKSEYPYHCELADNGDIFCKDCVLGVSHYKEQELEDNYKKIHDKHITLEEYECKDRIPLPLSRPRTDWKATIGCWFLLLLNFSLLTFDIYYVITQIIDKTFNISTAFLFVSFVCLFYVTLKYFWQIAMPKRKY